MSNLHLNLDEANKHTPKGFDNAAANTRPWKDESSQSTYTENETLPRALNFVDGTTAPPTTTNGHIYVITGTGTVNAGWGSASFNDWVRFANGFPVSISPVTGYLCYDITASQWMEFDGTTWAAFGGGGVVNTIFTGGTMSAPSTITMGGNALTFSGGNTKFVGDTEIDGVLRVKNNNPNLILFRPAHTVGNATGINFRLNNSSYNESNYGKIFGTIVSNSPGSENGKLEFQSVLNGSSNTRMQIEPDKVSIKGTGSTSATTALLVQNSLGTNLVEVKDDQKILFGENVGSALMPYRFNAPYAGSGEIMSLENTDTTTNSATGIRLSHSSTNSRVIHHGTTTIPFYRRRMSLTNTGEGMLFGVNDSGKDFKWYLAAASDSGVDMKLNETGLLLGNGIGASSPTAKLHVKGSGSTSATTALLVQNSLGTNLLEVKDDSSAAFNGNLGLFGTTPIAQPTTAVAASILGTGAGTGLTDLDTFDGYTLQQVVKALRNLGILA